MKLSILFIGFFIALCKGDGRIAGGQPTSISQYPFVVPLLTNSGAGNVFTHACGGTILTNNAVLSSASCFFTGTVADPVSQWRVRVGSSFRNGGGVIFVVNRITPNPNFNTGTLNNDIAVIRTRFNMNLQPGVAEAATIAGAGYTFVQNAVVYGVGWGKTSPTGDWSDEIRHVEIFVVNQQTCAGRYSELGFAVTNNMVCAGWLDVGVRGQCEGDNGGPLVDNGVVVGVFSWTRSCADYWYPAINTRVGSYTGWIVATAIAS
ncbi:trypsin, alkaline C-like [Ostrinia nubilalis]|uniref:trypsin, alkaline C-like n=1 Tax=Ostrinia nubilalis TaxID=29057 RepID=UPI0030823D78